MIDESPINMEYEEYEKSLSLPHPIGMSQKIFCLPSELIGTCTKMIKQIKFSKTLILKPNKVY